MLRDNEWQLAFNTCCWQAVVLQRFVVAGGRRVFAMVWSIICQEIHDRHAFKHDFVLGRGKIIDNANMVREHIRHMLYGILITPHPHHVRKRIIFCVLVWSGATK